jgi:hypothetical protein
MPLPFQKAPTTVNNVFFGHFANSYVNVYAGSSMADPSDGMVYIFTQSADSSPAIAPTDPITIKG